MSKRRPFGDQLAEALNSIKGTTDRVMYGDPYEDTDVPSLSDIANANAAPNPHPQGFFEHVGELGRKGAQARIGQLSLKKEERSRRSEEAVRKSLIDERASRGRLNEVKAAAQELKNENIQELDLADIQKRKAQAEQLSQMARLNVAKIEETMANASKISSEEEMLALRYQLDIWKTQLDQMDVLTRRYDAETRRKTEERELETLNKVRIPDSLSRRITAGAAAANAASASALRSVQGERIKGITNMSSPEAIFRKDAFNSEANLRIAQGERARAAAVLDEAKARQMSDSEIAQLQRIITMRRAGVSDDATSKMLTDLLGNRADGQSFKEWIQEKLSGTSGVPGPGDWWLAPDSEEDDDLPEVQVTPGMLDNARKKRP